MEGRPAAERNQSQLIAMAMGGKTIYERHHWRRRKAKKAALSCLHGPGPPYSTGENPTWDNRC